MSSGGRQSTRWNRAREHTNNVDVYGERGDLFGLDIGGGDDIGVAEDLLWNTRNATCEAIHGDVCREVRSDGEVVVVGTDGRQPDLVVIVGIGVLRDWVVEGVGDGLIVAGIDSEHGDGNVG